MRNYTLVHVRDAVLLRDLAELVAQDRVTAATLLAHIAEVDARRLFRPAGYPSMHAYCVDELRLSEDSASKRIQAARACRQFPVLFAALSEGKLHLATICLLAPHLRPENVNELIEAATHRRKYEVEELLARRYPLTEMTQRIRPIPAMTYEQEHAPGHVERAVSDPGLAFEDLGGLIRKCRTDFGVDIEIDVDQIRRKGTGKLSQWHVAIGRIRYDYVDETAPLGTLVYIKPSLTGDEPTDVQNYAEQHPEFAKELPRFLAAIWRLFNEYEIAGYVASQRPGKRTRLIVLAPSASTSRGKCAG